MKRALSLIVVIVALGNALYGQPAERGVTTFYLRAWIPHLRPALAQDPFERELVTVADDVLAFRFRDAETRLGRLRDSATTDRQRLLATLFRHELRQRRFRYVGGGESSGGDARVDLLDGEKERLLDHAFRFAVSSGEENAADALDARSYAEFLPLALEDYPASRRRSPAPGRDDEKAQQDALDELSAQLFEQLAAMNAKALRDGAVTPCEARLLEALVRGRVAAAAGDMKTAESAHDAALADAHPAGAAVILIERGDGLAFPFGDPRTLGFFFRDEREHPAALRKIAACQGHHRAPEAELATQPGGGEALGTRVLLLRAREVGWRNPRTDGNAAAECNAQVDGATGREPEGIVRWSAQISLALAHDETDRFADAVRGASAQQAYGAMLSFAGLAVLDATAPLFRALSSRPPTGLCCRREPGCPR